MPLPFKMFSDRNIEDTYVVVADALGLDPDLLISIRRYYLKIIDNYVGGEISFRELFSSCLEKYGDPEHCYYGLTLVSSEVLAYCITGYGEMILVMHRSIEEID